MKVIESWLPRNGMKGMVLMTNIEELIKQLHGNRNTNKISVVLYDPVWNNYHLIYKINKQRDTCVMMSTSIDTNHTSVEVSLPFISQLNEYYSHCVVDKSNEWIGIAVKDIINTYGYY